MRQTHALAQIMTHRLTSLIGFIVLIERRLQLWRGLAPRRPLVSVMR